MLAELRARAWQLGAIGAAALVVILSIALAVSAANLRRVVKERDDVRASITAPVTGWAARLTTVQANQARLQAAVNDQNARLAAITADGAGRIAAAEKDLVEARRGQTKAEAQIASLMKPLVGGDLCLRVQEADARLMETLK